MSYIGKVYYYQSEENYDDFLEIFGLPDEEVEKLKNSKPSSQLVKEGDKYKYISTTPEGSKETVFESGVPFFEVGPAGYPMRITYTVDGNTVSQLVQGDKGSAVFKREYNGDDLKVTITARGWDGVAYRYYKA